MPLAVNVPGRKNSGPLHWQTHWESQIPWLHRVTMSDWEFPDRRDWVNTLEREIDCALEPVFLVTHSLGGLTIPYLSQSVHHKIKGAFIVAPPDLSSYSPPAIVLQTFPPIPEITLRFPSVIVASSTDPYCPIQYAQKIASAWGSRFINIGMAEHISSNLDGWADGLQMFLAFVHAIEQNAVIS